MARAIKLSMELEVQLDRNATTQPMIAILAMARTKATTAVHELIRTDPNNSDVIRALQNEILRYDDLVEFTKDALAAGIEAHNKLSDEDKAEFAEIFMNPEARAEIEALGGNPEEHDA